LMFFAAEKNRILYQIIYCLEKPIDQRFWLG